MAAPPQQLIFAGSALIPALVAALYDIRERRIPNRLTGPALATGLLLHFAIDGWGGMGSSLLAALAAGAIFLLFFLAGGMGAGDVKLMASVGALTGLQNLSTTMLATVLLGGVFALALAASRGRLRETFGNVGALVAHHSTEGLRPHPELNLSNANTLRLPFAVPIAAGCLVTLFSSAWGPVR